MNKKSSNKLALKMFIAMILGLASGVAFIFIRQSLLAGNNPETWTTIYNLLFADITAEATPTNALGIFYIIGQLFINSLQIIIIPMVFTSIVLAFCKISDTKKLGRISAKTIGIFLFTTAGGLLIASIVGYSLYKMNAFSAGSIEGLNQAQGSTGSNPLAIIINIIPNNLITAFSSNSRVLSIVFIAVCIGLISHKLNNKIEVIKKLCEEIHEIITIFLSFIISKFGPLCIYVLLVRTFAIYGVDHLKPALVYVVATVITLLVYLLIFYPSFVYITTKLSPKIFMKKISKVAVFGFSTSSSAATLPLNLETTVNELGVDEEVASFTLPLGMTINMDGTAIMQVLATIFVAASAGYSLTFTNIIIISILALIASVGTPAAPGAGAVILFTILSGLGFTSDAALLAYALILAINRPIEMLVTSLNVVGDSTTALIVSKSENLLNEAIYNKE